jgi:glycosyltransferase involved in cell wall biosynthesis
VAAHRPGARLAVVGGAVPAYSRTFDAECKRLGIADDVTRLGNVGPERVYGLMKSARCVLAASRTEGWGTATCEALAAGAPVVAFDLPTTRYVFGEAVDLIPPFDAQAFARRVLKHLATPSAREAVDRRRAHVRQFDWSGVAGRDIAAIDEVSRSQSSRF